MVISKRLISLFLISLILLPISSQVFGAELGHKFVQETTRQTTSSTSDVTVLTLSNTDLVAGEKYLLVATAQKDHSDVNDNTRTRVRHGSTIFEGSYFDVEPNTATTIKYTYFWYTVWTVVASEDITIGHSAWSSGDTAGIDQITLSAIKLSGDLTENTDWFFAEDLDDTTIQSAWADDTNTASITFTPNGTDDWLILATAQLDPDSSAVQFETRINASGGVTDTGVIMSQEGEHTTDDRMVHTLAKVYTPSASSTTFETETQRETADGGSKLYNSMFALNLNKLRNHAQHIVSGEITLDSTNDFSTPTNVSTKSMNPDVTGDVWILAFHVADVGGTFGDYKSRLQIDDADQPETQTTDNYVQNQSWDQTDELHWATQTMENLSSGTSHTADVDATDDETTMVVEDRVVLMVSMELPAAGGGNCDACNTDQKQNLGWIFAIAGLWNHITSWFTIPEQNAEAQVQEPNPLPFKVVAQFTSTRSETQIRNFFNNQVIPKLENAINNRLQSEFTNAQVDFRLDISKNGNNYEVYPKIVITGVTQTQIDTLLQKYDLAVDDMTTTMLTDINNLGINNVKWHIHKSFGSVDI